MSDEVTNEMNDERSSLTVLTDAFAELERRADRVSAEVPYVLPAAGRRRRWPVVAAAAAGVAVVATGAALLAQPDKHPGRTAAGGSSPVSRPSTTGSTPSSRDERVPTSPEEIARRFQAALDDVTTRTATFTVTDTGHAVTVTLPSPSGRINAPVHVPNGSQNGAAIVGRLTVGAATGGYDVQMMDAHGAKASCDDPTHCSFKVFADGTTVAVGQDELEGGGVTYVADVVRTDGVEVLLHVSNRKDPKGAGPVLAAKPPLSLAQVRAVVLSNRW